MDRLRALYKFLTYDIWRITEGEVTRLTYRVYTVIKTIYLCVARFLADRVMTKASALTYSTLLAIVPTLAILFAVARGFGFDNVMEQQVETALGSNTMAASAILELVNSYLSQTKGGVFIGVGLIMLLWTVLNLINGMESIFNQIWQVKRGRSLYRKLTDYFSMLLVIPVLLVVSGGLSIYMTTFVQSVERYELLAPIGRFFIKLIPYVLTWCMFTALYAYLPNTRVRLRHALLAGILAGSAYQAFQYLYINSQLWVSRYNAIYGSFAALPLLLLWLQISWTICLFGVELTYVGQNLRLFSFDKDTRAASRRYRDFVAIILMSRIVKRFVGGQAPYTMDELSAECSIPIRLTQQTLYELGEVGLIHEVGEDGKVSAPAYQPSVDVSTLSVGMLLDKLYTQGAENFKVDREHEFATAWTTLSSIHEQGSKLTADMLLREL